MPIQESGIHVMIKPLCFFKIRKFYITTKICNATINNPNPIITLNDFRNLRTSGHFILATKLQPTRKSKCTHKSLQSSFAKLTIASAATYNHCLITEKLHDLTTTLRKLTILRISRRNHHVGKKK